MFGIEDKSVILAYLLCILSTLICIVYGVINWNKGSESVDSQDVKWAKEEDKVDKEF